VSNFRAVIAPKGTGADAVAFWQTRFAQLSETPEWKADREKNLWSAHFMDSAKTGAMKSCGAAFRRARCASRTPSGKSHC